MEVAKAVNIDDILEKYPYQMSGGQQQRVACARSIIRKPVLLLADEPTGALDSKSAKQLLTSFMKLNQEEEATILMVTHDAYTASAANRILFVKDGVLFDEIYKGNDTRKAFFNHIMDVQAVLGGGEGVDDDE
jgi:putative ABC transport system ATP-binding protein